MTPYAARLTEVRMATTDSSPAVATAPKERGADRHGLTPPVLPPPAREPVGHFMRELFLGGVLWGLLLLALAVIPVIFTVAVTTGLP